MRSAIVLFAAFVVACGSSSTSDAGADSSTDGTTGSDSSASDSSTSDTGTGTDTGSGGDGGSVAQCQALAKNFEMKCNGSNPRPCLWQGYGKLCEAGQTKLLIDSMNCLLQSTCRTFSDPNQGAACLATVHTAGESSAAKAFIQNTCMACAGSNCGTVLGTAEIFPYLTDSDIAAVANCRGNACTIDDIVKACPNVPGIALFTPCVN